MDKKMLNDEELNNVVGGETYIGWCSVFYCSKCGKPYQIEGDIETYTCPECGEELQRKYKSYYEPGVQQVTKHV